MSHPLVFRSGFNRLLTANHITLLCCACAGHALTISFSHLVLTYSIHTLYTQLLQTWLEPKQNCRWPRHLHLCQSFCFVLHSKLHSGIQHFCSPVLPGWCFPTVSLYLLVSSIFPRFFDPAEWMKSFKWVSLVCFFIQPFSRSWIKPAPVGSFLLTFSTGTSRALLAHLHKFWMRLGLRSPSQSPSHNPSGLS